MAHTKLTKRVVDALTCPPDKVRVTLFDSEIAGLHVEAMRTGRKYYRLKWKRRGQQGRETLGEHGVITLEQARGRATALRGRLYEGQSPAQKRAAEAEAGLRAISISELIETWLREGRAAAPTKRESSWKTDARKLRTHIVPLLDWKGAGEITRVDIENAQWKIAQGATANDKKTSARGRSIVRGGEGVARSAIMSLSACFSWALSRGIIEANPCRGLKKPKPRKRERFLSQEEAMQLFRCLDLMEARLELDRGFADVVRLLLLTGARKSEIQNLEWGEIDFDRCLIRLPRERSKTGEKHVPLNAEAVRILRARRDQNIEGRFVFPARRGDGPAQGLQKAWERVRAQAGLEDVRIHDLRHSFASFAVASGASLFLVGKALGHSQAQTTERYAHLRDEPLHAVAASVQRSIFPDSVREP